MEDLQISTKEVSERIALGDKLFLLDVREHWEYELCGIPGATRIPLGTLSANLNTLLDKG
jgi:sulfur-carrier protein adenylyltransferase/sulfurtransferase